MKKEETLPISARIPAKLMTSFKEICKRKGLKMKFVLKDLLTDYVEEEWDQ